MEVFIVIVKCKNLLNEREIIDEIFTEESKAVERINDIYNMKNREYIKDYKIDKVNYIRRKVKD